MGKILNINGTKNIPKGEYFLGISLSSFNFFSKEKVSYICELIDNSAENFLILIADSLEIWNNIYFKQYSLEKSIEEARRVGQQFQRGYNKLSHQNPKIKTILTSELNKTPHYESVYNHLIYEYLNNDNFNYEVKYQVKFNLKSKIESIGTEQVSDILCLYLLEELAITVCIYLGTIMNKKIQISPKEDKVLSNLYLGKYKSLYEKLSLNSKDYKYVIFKE